jgi:hypothetical protein
MTGLARQFHCHHVLFNFENMQIREAESSACKGILLLVDLCSTSIVVLQSDCTQDYKSEVLDGYKAGHLH